MYIVVTLFIYYKDNVVTKKLVKHGNSLALVIEKPLLNILKINENTDLEITIENNALIIKSASLNNVRSQTQDIDGIAKKIMDQYDDLFKKLSKT